jgi:hypothetical protein
MIHVSQTAKVLNIEMVPYPYHGGGIGMSAVNELLCKEGKVAFIRSPPCAQGLRCSPLICAK